MQTNKVTLREKVGYSLGDVAANLVFQMMMIFQLKFYTDIFGLVKDEIDPAAPHDMESIRGNIARKRRDYAR